MKIFSSEQMHKADAYTIEHEPITSIGLMERASQKLVDAAQWNKPSNNKKLFYIFCGIGNNGGDGLAIARILHQHGHEVHVNIVGDLDKASSDCKENLCRLQALGFNNFNNITSAKIEDIPANAIILDGIFGSGLNRPITGLTAQIIERVNSLPNERIAIDIPSGLYADKPVEQDAVVFHADKTYTFQAPKLQFLFAENEQYVGHFEVIDIQLINPFNDAEAPVQFVTSKDIHIQRRHDFSHKGTFGHALLVSGSYGKMGAAILASRSCLTTGCGLLTTHVPSSGNIILQIAVPEAMTDIDEHERCTSSIPHTEKYSAIGIGPGLGTEQATINAIRSFLMNNSKPTVIDADALNIIAQNDDLWKYIRPNTILTPHPGEFDRLTTKHKTCYERFLSQIALSQKTSCVIVLKGRYTTITTPEGNIYFNSTGNPGMATAGSGDVLTGMITSLLAQGYAPIEAAKIGVFLHGQAGDTSALRSQETVTASDIINCINFNIVS